MGSDLEESVDIQTCAFFDHYVLTYDWMVTSWLIRYLLRPQTNSQVTCIGAPSLGTDGPAVESVAFFTSICTPVPSWQFLHVPASRATMYIQSVQALVDLTFVALDLPALSLDHINCCLPNMSWTRPHACHERSFSAPIRRKIRQKGIHNQFNYDSDSVRSEAYTESTCGADNHSFKDSGYSTLHNIPAGSPRSIIDFLSLEEDDSTPAPLAPVVVNARLEWHDQARDQTHSPHIQHTSTAPSLGARWTSCVNDSASWKTPVLNGGYENLPQSDGEAGAWMDACCAVFFTRSSLTDRRWAKQGSDESPEFTLTHYDNTWLMASEHISSLDRPFDQKAAVQGVHAATVHKRGKQSNLRLGKRVLPRKPIISPHTPKTSSRSSSLGSSDRRLSRYPQRFKFWRPPVDNAMCQEEGGDDPDVRSWNEPNTLLEEEVPVTQTTSTVFGPRPINAESQEATPVTTEICGPARDDAIEDPCFTALSLPSNLPSAIAALEIKHYVSQTSNSLDRTPDSSRTLNTLSEGEMSFIGVANAGMSRVIMNDPLDHDMADCLEDLARRIVRRCLRESRCSALKKHGGHQADCCTSSSSSSSTHSTPNVSPVTSATKHPCETQLHQKKPG